MRTGNKLLLLAAAGLLLALLGAVWLVPPQLDWNRYRQSVEVIASSTLGRPVRIAGPISLSLLPRPVLLAQGVEIDDADQATAPSLRVRALRLRVAIAPLLAGRIAPRELVLRQPELSLPWPLPRLFTLRTPDWPDSFSARIEDGRLTLGRLEFSGVAATVEGSDTGALALSGTAQTGPLGWHVTARLTSPGADGGQGIDVALDGTGRAVGLGATFAGQIAPSGALDGRIAGRGPDLSVLLPTPAVAFRGEGRLTASGALAAADNLLLEVDGSSVQGAVALRLAPREQLSVALAAGRLDLGPWLAALRRGNAPPIPMDLDLSAEAARLGGGTLRRLRASLALADGAITIREAAARLPGEAELRFAGPVVTRDGGLRIAGEASLDAADLRPTLAWVAGFTGAGAIAFPPGVLHSASLAARVTAGPGELVLDKLHGDLDRAPVDGRLALRFGEHPTFDADLRFAQLALDPWLPEEKIGLTALPGRFAGSSLRVTAAHATLWHRAIDDFALDATGRDGTFTLRELAGKREGVQARLDGALEPDGRIHGATLALRGTEVAAIADLLPAEWQTAREFCHGPVDARITADGPPQALDLGIRVDLEDARLEAQPLLDLTRNRWNAPVTLRHPGARRLLRAAGLPFAAGAVGEGSLAVSGRFAGEPGRLGAESFELVAGMLHAAGKLTLDHAGPRPRLTGRLAAETLPLPLPAEDAEPLPIESLRAWDVDMQIEADQVLAGQAPVLRHATARLALGAERFRLDAIRGSLAGGQLEGSASLDLAEDRAPALHLDGALRQLALAGPATGLAFDLTGGKVGGRISLTAEGYSLAALLATASGRAAFDASDGTLSGLDLAAVTRAVAEAGAKAGARPPAEPAAEPATERWNATAAAIGDALSGGTTAFRSLAAELSLSQGVVTIDTGRLDASSGSIGLSGTVGLPEGALDVRATLRPNLPDPPAIGLRLAGPAEAPRRTPELAGLAQWLADHPAQ